MTASDISKIKSIKSDVAKIAKDKLLDEVVKIPKEDWKDGLLIRTPNWLGDAAMSLPAIKLLLKIIPQNCAIFAVTIPSLKQLFESVREIDKVLTLEAPHRNWSRTDTKKTAFTHCGVAILFNNSFRDSFFMRLSLPFAKIYGSSARCAGLFLTKSFKFRHSLDSKEHHHASRYLSIAYAFGSEEWDGSFPELDECKEPEITKSEIIEFTKKDKRMVIAPGAAYGPAKQWLPEYFAELCRFWIEDKGGNVAIIAGNKEADCAAKIANIVNCKQLANFAGKTDLHDVMRIIRNCSFCVCNDSGIMHLAAALGAPGIAIFGSTNPYATSPLSDKWTVLYSEEPCSPCLSRECRFSHYNCLRNIKPEHVIAEIEKFCANLNKTS